MPFLLIPCHSTIRNLLFTKFFLFFISYFCVQLFHHYFSVFWLRSIYIILEPKILLFSIFYFFLVDILYFLIIRLLVLVIVFNLIFYLIIILIALFFITISVDMIILKLEFKCCTINKLCFLKHEKTQRLLLTINPMIVIFFLVFLQSLIILFLWWKIHTVLLLFFPNFYVKRYDIFYLFWHPKLILSKIYALFLYIYYYKSCFFSLKSSIKVLHIDLEYTVLFKIIPIFILHCLIWCENHENILGGYLFDIFCVIGVSMTKVAIYASTRLDSFIYFSL